MISFRLLSRRGLVAGAAVVVLAGSAVGIASAQTAPTPTPGAGQQRPGAQAFLDALAKRLNITTAALQSAIGQARTDVGLPADGGFPGGRGHGPGGPGRGPGGFVGADEHDDVALAARQRRRAELGLGPRDLAREPVDQPHLRPGRREVEEILGIDARERPGIPSLAQVAQAHGKTANDVATALKNAANQRIDQEVSAGRLNATDAAQRKQDVATRIDQLVNQVRPQGGAPRGEPVAPAA